MVSNVAFAIEAAGAVTTFVLVLSEPQAGPVEQGREWTPVVG